MDLQDTRGGIIGEPESKVIKPFDGDLLKFQSEMTRIEPADGKIYDITHADTLEHSVGLPAGYPENTRAIIAVNARQAGTGFLRMRTTSGSSSYMPSVLGTTHAFWVRAVDGQFYYRQTVANDDFDVYALGYLTGV